MTGQLEYFFKQREWSKDELEDNRQRTLDAVERWKKADAELERVCNELGIEKLEMTL